MLKLRNRNKSKEKQLEAAEVKISHKQLLLIDSLLQKIQDERTKHYAEYKKAKITQRELMDKELYNNCLHVNDWTIFKNLMNKTLNNIVTILETNYTEITHKELTLCCLFLLNIPIQDIALILETQPGSIYKLKQRLTQKIKLMTLEDDADDEGTTVLIWACKRGRIDMVLDIISGDDRDINKGDAKGYTPLMWAGREGYIEIVKIFYKTKIIFKIC